MPLYTITFILLLLFFGFVISYEYYEHKTKVSVFPTMPGIRNKIIEILKNDRTVRQADETYTILDLGSGSGQLTWRIAQALPKAKVVGIELSYIPWLRSVLRQRLFGPANLSYLRLDFWPYDTSSFHAVVTYLPGRIMDRVGEKLRKELKPGALVVANTFPLKADWTPLETQTLKAPFKTNLYVYRQG